MPHLIAAGVSRRPSARRFALWALVALAGGAAFRSAYAELPTGWGVHTFTGRIVELETDGGVLAAATDGGLLLFDRVTRRFATIADAGCTDGQCLTSNRLTCVSRDAAGAYWLGTLASGVVVFRPTQTDRPYGRFFALNTAPGGGLLADSLSCIEAWSNETVYAGTSRGVAQIDLVAGVDSYNEDASRRLGTDLRGSRIQDLAVDSLHVWVATDSGVTRYRREPPYAAEAINDSLVGLTCLTIEVRASTVYAGTPVGLFTWDEPTTSWRRVRNCATCPPTPSFPVRSVARLADGRLYAGSNNVVNFYNGFAWGPVSPPGVFLLNDRRFDTVEVTGDTLWTSQVNDDGEGNYIEARSTTTGAWTRFAPNNIPASEPQAMRLGPQGDLWVGTRLAGVARLNPSGAWCIWNGDDPNVRADMTDEEGHVAALLAPRDGSAWFSTLPQGAPGITDILTPSATCDHTSETWAHLLPEQPGFGGRTWGMTQDGEGNVYLLNDGEFGGTGIDVISEDRSQTVHITADILGGGAVGALAFATTSSAWDVAYVGLNGMIENGLLRWNRSDQLFDPPPTSNNFLVLALPDSFSIGGYRDIVVTPGNPTRLWVGTDNNLFEYDVTQQRVVTAFTARLDARPGLLSGDVKDLQFDDFGNLWVATTRGLNRLRLAERVGTGAPPIDAYTTIEMIRELNAASSAGQIYDPRRVLAPLPAPKLNALTYDSNRDLLTMASELGLATLDVVGFNPPPVIALDRAVLWPNPVRFDAGHTEVRIANIAEPATVTIFNLEGQIVCEVTDREDGDVIWSLTTPSCLEGEGNFRIASGLYPVRIRTSAGTTMRTLAVVR